MTRPISNYPRIKHITPMEPDYTFSDTIAGALRDFVAILAVTVFVVGVACLAVAL